ncbi:hypothetical protein HHI36_001183 [Cryptolaemus montrouzieri]|uniref:Uncharacterized protein n=1 Tax=Cryptolaemus montrouzieri TaxID=559131 RepID=A0ABD2P7J7_9CUCU
MIFNLIWNLLNVLFFLNGFCPLLYNNQSDKIQHIGMSSNLNISEFDRTILMIVDALRLDFIRKDYMPHTTSLIEKHGCFMDVKVSSPTVTLPRIKALTTGSIPQFVDIFYNIGNPQCVSESLLHSVQQKKKNIIFFGDDTWLKVFPHMFHRQEGTTSFLVTDFHEVDDNVTRNINSELEREDWNLMILHYLDHHRN